MKKTIQILVVALVFFSSTAFAQMNLDAPKKWGIETELIQPFLPNVGIVRIVATCRLTAAEKKQGDFLIGAV